MKPDEMELLERRLRSWQRDLRRKVFYHLTHRDNLPSIQRRGLLPSCPETRRHHGLGESSFEMVEGCLFLGRTKREALQQLTANRFMYLYAPKRRDTVLLTVALPPGHELDEDDNGLIFTTEVIPPEYILKVERF